MQGNHFESRERSHTVPPSPRNARTFFAPEAAHPRASLSPRASFLLAHERLSLLANASAERSVVIAAVDVAGQVVAARRVFHGQAVILGRHEHCGLRLPADSIALRQLAGLVQLDGRRSVVHIRDLATRLPFLTEDRQATAGVTADGPLYLAVGEYAIWFVPSEVFVEGRARGGGAEAAWNALPARSFSDRRPPVDSPVHPSDSLQAGARAPASEPARVTRVAPPLLLDGGDAPEVAWGVLRVEMGARKEKRWVSAERLEQGILLGRYSRCSVLVDAYEATTSRVHALMLRLGAEVWVIDLASTNGVSRNGARLSAEVLRDTDRIHLGTQVVIDWTRTRHAQA